MILRAVDWHWTLAAMADALVEQTGMGWSELEPHLQWLAGMGLVEVGMAQSQGPTPWDPPLEMGVACVTAAGHARARRLAN